MGFLVFCFILFWFGGVFFWGGGQGEVNSANIFLILIIFIVDWD